ncbi:MAG: hypothetical protein M0R80_18600 [Proteobacteria bacterium]|jgi:hypothetical protein|nr:hypothetical protein [Pseudomonadota bacterium]
MFLWLKKRTKIEALREGEERVVEGRVVPAKEIGVPGTQLKCVYYHLLVDKWDRGARGKGRKMWIPISAEERAVGFFLEDGTGRAWVAADDKRLAAAGGAEEAGTYGKKGTQRFIARLVRAGDVVRVRAIVDAPKGAEPGDVLVLRAGGEKDRLEILFRKRARL